MLCRVCRVVCVVCRDVPSMIRINGKIVNGRTDNEKVLIAYRILHDGLAGNEKLVNLVMSLANQNHGIFMYEKLVQYAHPLPCRRRGACGACGVCHSHRATPQTGTTHR